MSYFTKHGTPATFPIFVTASPQMHTGATTAGVVGSKMPRWVGSVVLFLLSFLGGSDPLYNLYLDLPGGSDPLYNLYLDLPGGLVPLYNFYLALLGGWDPLYKCYLALLDGLDPFYHFY